MTPAKEEFSGPLASPPAVEVPSRPALRAGVRLLGNLQDSGFQEQQWLVERDGQFFQFTELLYRIAECLDGQRTVDEVAHTVSASTDWLLDEDDVRKLIGSKLMPLGLVATASPHEQESAYIRSPLSVYMRMRMVSPRILDPFTKVLQALFWPPILVLVLVAAAAAHWWMYRVQGLEQSVQQTLRTPGGLLTIVLILMLGGFFHELGHASALRYGGGRARRMGVGLYLIYPAFFTDVSEAYRLRRTARIRTDLGGVYFHAIFAMGLVLVSLASGSQLVLFAALLINMDIARQFIPFVRLDGYWLLADITGIPDLFSQMGPFLRSVVRIPGWTGSKLPPLKGWVRKTFTVYIAATVPTLAFLFYLMITNLPTFLIATRDGVVTQASMFSSAQAQGNWTVMLLLAISMVFLALPVLGTFYILLVAVRGILRFAWTVRKMRLAQA